MPLTRSAGCRGPSSRVTSQQSVCGQVVTRCVRCVYRSTCDRSHVTPHPPRPDHAETWTPLPSWARRAPRGLRAAPCSAPRARCPLVPVLGWTPPTQQEGGISRMQKHGSATGSCICASGNVHGGATEIWPPWLAAGTDSALTGSPSDKVLPHTSKSCLLATEQQSCHF